MKLGRDVLLTSAVLAAMGTNVQADSFREALTGGKVSGEIRNVYVEGSASDARGEAGALNNSHTLGSAINLNYATGSFHGFKAVVELQLV